MDAEVSDELDGEEVEVINPVVGHYSNSSPTKTSVNTFHSKLIFSTPRNLQPVLSSPPSSIPPPSPKPSTTRPVLASPNESITHPTSQDITSYRREAWSPLQFLLLKDFKIRSIGQ
ncbi:hypothetical protein O181_068747 [Austropuccinia psidii MF-1]|uniref:Uncharacterized protein n=1 Tax=Austropuccinia psidii MF-1 TaxID=1389203 RepID=A0A9Q3I6K6_9BASI|nr:hypothetical protein [Austropuccinia psidii MF-1]